MGSWCLGGKGKKIYSKNKFVLSGKMLRLFVVRSGYYEVLKNWCTFSSELQFKDKAVETICIFGGWNVFVNEPLSSSGVGRNQRTDIKRSKFLGEDEISQFCIRKLRGGARIVRRCFWQMYVCLRIEFSQLGEWLLLYN